MADPKRSIELLIELVDLNFTNEAYWRVHPFRDADPPRKDTISRHISYCKKTKTFPYGRTGERVQTRLEFVLKEYKADRHKFWRTPRTFESLADLAYKRIPALS